MSTMGDLKLGAEIMVYSTAISSLIFMGLVFYAESILGHGMFFIEPNRPLAFVELLLTAYGLIGMSVMYIRRLLK